MPIPYSEPRECFTEQNEFGVGERCESCGTTGPRKQHEICRAKPIPVAGVRCRFELTTAVRVPRFHFTPVRAISQVAVSMTIIH